MSLFQKVKEIDKDVSAFVWLLPGLLDFFTGQPFRYSVQDIDQRDPILRGLPVLLCP